MQLIQDRNVTKDFPGLKIILASKFGRAAAIEEAKRTPMNRLFAPQVLLSVTKYVFTKQVPAHGVESAGASRARSIPSGLTPSASLQPRVTS